MEGGEDWPAGDADHFRQLESDVAAEFLFRRVDQTNFLIAVDQQADGHAGLAKQPLELGLRAGLPVPRIDIFRVVKPVPFGSTWTRRIHLSFLSGSKSRRAYVGRSVSL